MKEHVNTAGKVEENELCTGLCPNLPTYLCAPYDGDYGPDSN